ncbi:MAG: gliding motility-associated C-terminal domain-containing protein, partial [Bacteroidetes bacterium]|nr:gliding motility-associated C-terminal domain-containing protein [Bacteroidota bacterium]
GTPTYTYQWNDGQTTSSATGLTAGNYFVAIIDSKGCQTNNSLSVAEPASAISGILIPVNPSCGFSNGTVSSQVSGGMGPYSYLWTPGAFTSQNISSVGPGNYILQVTDAASCTATFSVTLTNIPGPTAVVSSVNNVSCFGGNNGSATATILQGTAPYTYSWTPYGGNDTTATSLIAGTYSVHVTDALGCTISASAVVTEPIPVNVSISSVTPVSCRGGNNGASTVSVSGGTPNYSYLWNNGQTNASATGFVAGTYTVTVSDQNTCSASITINISQPAFVLVASITSALNPSCFGGTGSATAASTGGTIPYFYSWSTTPVQTSNTAIVKAGSYTVTVTDANGCTSSSNVTLSQPTQVITSAGPNDTICLIPALVTLTSTASGGTGTYSYVWHPSGQINSGTLNITPSSSITYTVIAYDQNGCTGTPDTATAMVYSLAAANVKVTSLSPICPGQPSFVYVQPSGSQGPFTYQWSPNVGTGPGAYVVTPAQPTTYSVTVTNHCGTSVTDTVQILFNPPPTLSFSVDPSSSCIPLVVQYLDSSVTGNSADPITSWYWDFGDGFSSTLSNPAHMYTQPGTYSVVLTITTSGGCTSNNSSAPVTVTAFPSPTAYFTTTPSVNPMSDNNLTISFNNQSSGDTSRFWNFGDGSISNVINPQHHFFVSGFYTIMLITTNEFGCTDTFIVQTSGEGDIVFPNAFTPDPSGPNGGTYNPFNLDNNVFFPFGTLVEDFRMQVYSRWGELLFETSDIKIGWDGYYRGKLCQQDVYVWKASGKLMNGKTFSKVGDVTLLR